jgi:hypothetical protein
LHEGGGGELSNVLDEMLGDGAGSDAAEESPDAGHGDEEGDVAVAHGDAHLAEVVHHGESRAHAHQERREHEPEVERSQRLPDRVLLPELRPLAGAPRLLGLRRRIPPRRLRVGEERRGGREVCLLEVGVVGHPRLDPRLPGHVRRYHGGGREEHEQHGNEYSRDDPAADAREVRGEEVQSDGHRERVDRGEAAAVVLLVIGRGRALAEEQRGDGADRGRHDGEHDEERRRVVGEERGADVGEDRRTKADVALEQARHGAPAPPEVADAGDIHVVLFPPRQRNTHICQYGSGATVRDTTSHCAP